MLPIPRLAQAARRVLVSAWNAFLKGHPGIVIFATVTLLSAQPAAAQAAAEYGQVIAGASANVTGLNKAIGSALSPGKKLDSTLTSDKKSGFAPPTEEVAGAANRRALEQRAGKDAAKLNLKSFPAKASVRIDGKPVGQTPLVLTLAPGSYKIEMEGPRMEFGKQQIDLRPQESRDLELLLSAAPRYPTHIELR